MEQNNVRFKVAHPGKKSDLTVKEMIQLKESCESCIKFMLDYIEEMSGAKIKAISRRGDNGGNITEDARNEIDIKLTLD